MCPIGPIGRILPDPRPCPRPPPGRVLRHRRPRSAARHFRPLRGWAGRMGVGLPVVHKPRLHRRKVGGGRAGGITHGSVRGSRARASQWWGGPARAHTSAPTELVSVEPGFVHYPPRPLWRTPPVSWGKGLCAPGVPRSSEAWACPLSGQETVARGACSASRGHAQTSSSVAPAPAPLTGGASSSCGLAAIGPMGRIGPILPDPRRRPRPPPDPVLRHRRPRSAAQHFRPLRGWE